MLQSLSIYLCMTHFDGNYFDSRFMVSEKLILFYDS